MVKNLFRNRGGLHNRVTARIALMPFTLSECEKYAAERGLAMSRDDIAECFMVFGGIPYYWRNLRPGASLAQNIDALLFRPNAPMKGEFGELYKSLFGKSAAHSAPRRVRWSHTDGTDTTDREHPRRAKVAAPSAPRPS